MKLIALYKHYILHGLLLLGVCSAILWLVYLKSDQIAYPYPLDDSYIHLAISKSLVEHGSMSADPARFDFSSSSPLFTIILSLAFFITAPSVWWPLILGVFSGLVLLMLVYQHFESQRLDQKGSWIWIVVFFTPLPLLMMMGMEHSLQLLLCFLWLRQWLVIEEEKGKFSYRIILLTILLVTIRYEGLFLVAAGSSWWMIQKKWKAAFSIGLTSGVTVIGLGLCSMKAGGTFLPLSLLMKGHHPELALSSLLSFTQLTLEKVYEHPFIFSILTISAIGMWNGEVLPSRLRAFSFLLQITSWLHVILAEIGGYRYEAYLVFLHLILLTELLKHYNLRLSFRMVLAGIWLLIPMLIRSVFFTVNYPLAVQNIHHQSVQVGEFIQAYYPDTPIAIQDIGVATWLSDFPLTDLAGIADGEVNQLFRDHSISPETIRPILENRGVELAIIQQGWMGWVIPGDWQAAGSWTIQDNLIIALPEVFFWAGNQEVYEELMNNLREFSHRLPESIIEEGPYIGSPMPEVERAP